MGCRRKAQSCRRLPKPIVSRKQGAGNNHPRKLRDRSTTLLLLPMSGGGQSRRAGTLPFPSGSARKRAGFWVMSEMRLTGNWELVCRTRHLIYSKMIE